MKVHQIYTGNDLRNFNYIIEFENQKALVIDPWDAIEINNFLDENNLQPKAILNTHEHWDHVQGNLELVKKHNCEVWAHENGRNKIPGLTRTLQVGEEIILDQSSKLVVLDTPGHTMAHLCFLLIENDHPIAVFTGDTLFNAGVGRCDSGGAVDVLYHTITEQFASLDDDVVVYPGHEYLENNLNFTLSLEPSNETAKEWLVKTKKSDPFVQPLTTTIGDEREINTFFRLDNEEIKDNLNQEFNSELEVFAKLRATRNSW